MADKIGDKVQAPDAPASTGCAPGETCTESVKGGHDVIVRGYQDYSVVVIVSLVVGAAAGYIAGCIAGKRAARRSVKGGHD